MRLRELSLNQSAIVKGIDKSLKGRKRLEHLGLTVGVAVKVIRFAPFGDPIEIKIRDFRLALRKDDAEKIFVELK